jgi:hypothetical protein
MSQVAVDLEPLPHKIIEKQIWVHDDADYRGFRHIGNWKDNNNNKESQARLKS